MATKQNIVSFDVSIKTMERVFDAGWGHDERVALLCNVIGDPRDNTLAMWDAVIVVNRDTPVVYRGWNDGNLEVKATVRSLQDGMNDGARGNCGMSATVAGHRTTSGVFVVKSITVEAEVFDGVVEAERQDGMWLKYGSEGVGERIFAIATEVAWREMTNVGASDGKPARFAVLRTGDAGRLVVVTVQKPKMKMAAV